MLTKDAEKLFSLLYGLYLESREAGESKANAKNFGGPDLIKEKLLIDWSIADIEETCWELAKAGLLKTNNSDNGIYLVFLTDQGIVYAENRFKNGLKDVIQFLSAIGLRFPPIPLSGP